MGDNRKGAPGESLATKILKNPFLVVLFRFAAQKHVQKKCQAETN